MKPSPFKIILFVMVLVAMTLSACGGATTVAPATVAPATVAPATVAPTGAPTTVPISGTITVLSNRTDLDADGTLAKYSTEFAALYPGVTVKWETMTDYAGELQTRMNTTDYGDVLLIPPALTADKFADFLTPLGSAADLGKKYLFIPSEGTFNGTVYGIAVTGNGQGLVYNKDVFKAAGITDLPKTPADFQTDLGLIKTKTQAIPLYTNYHAGWPLTQWDSQIESVSGAADIRNVTIPHQDAPFAAGEP